MKKLIKRVLQKAENRTVLYIKSCMPKEEWSATIHEDHIYLARGSMLFMLGPCQSVVDKVFQKPVDLLRKEPQTEKNKSVRSIEEIIISYQRSLSLYINTHKYDEPKARYLARIRTIEKFSGIKQDSVFKEESKSVEA